MLGYSIENERPLDVSRLFFPVAVGALSFSGDNVIPMRNHPVLMWLIRFNRLKNKKGKEIVPGVMSTDFHTPEIGSDSPPE